MLIRCAWCRHSSSVEQMDLKTRSHWILKVEGWNSFRFTSAHTDYAPDGDSANPLEKTVLNQGVELFTCHPILYRVPNPVPSGRKRFKTGNGMMD